jgi:hypothetical protein
MSSNALEAFSTKGTLALAVAASSRLKEPMV